MCLIFGPICVKSQQYLSYREVMDSIKAIENDFAECARKYDALEVWPDLATQNVCFFKHFT
jgi:hypothetical protein